MKASLIVKTPTQPQLNSTYHNLKLLSKPQLNHNSTQLNITLIELNNEPNIKPNTDPYIEPNVKPNVKPNIEQNLILTWTRTIFSPKFT